MGCSVDIWCGANSANYCEALVMRTLVLAGFAALLAVCLWSAEIAYSHKQVKAEPTPCVAAANEQCPSAEWLKDYEGWKALNDEIEGSLKQKKDLRTGWANRLNDSMPPGYYFNVDTHKFQKREIPQPVAPKK